MTRAQALRWWRAGYQAGHQAAEHEQQAAARWNHLVASFRAQRAADQQARTDALLLEIIDALARLPAATATAKPDPLLPQHGITAKPRQNIYIKRCRTMCRQRGR